MKFPSIPMRLSLSAILVLFTTLLVAQPTYSTLYDSTRNAWQTFSGDFDGDGDVDIVTHSNEWPYDFIVWYENDWSGGQPMIPRGVIAENGTNDSLIRVMDLELADMDNDGDMDIVCAHDMGNAGEVFWYRADGSNQYTRILVNDSLNFPSHVEVADMNNDGRLDIVVNEHFEIAVYLSDVNYNFPQRDTAFVLSEFYALETADFNGDGWMDFATTSTGFYILTSNQDGTYTQTDHEGIGLMFGLFPEDADGDGDIDLFVWSHSEKFQLYTNNGQGDFSLHSTILTTDDIRSMELVDYDGDNDMDIVTSQGQLGQLIHLENSGGNYGNPTVLFEQSGELLYEFIAAPMDGDSIVDLAWVTTQTSGVLHSVNPSIGLNTWTNFAVDCTQDREGRIRLMSQLEEILDWEVIDAMGRIRHRGQLPPNSIGSYPALPGESLWIRLRSERGVQVVRPTFLSR